MIVMATVAVMVALPVCMIPVQCRRRDVGAVWAKQQFKTVRETSNTEVRHEYQLFITQDK